MSEAEVEAATEAPLRKMLLSPMIWSRSKEVHQTLQFTGKQEE